MKCIIGKKVTMTQVFKNDGTVVPVTIVSAGPCVVTQVKHKEKDSVHAIQVGFEIGKNFTKSEAGHLKNLPASRVLRDFRLEEKDAYERGDMWTVGIFTPGEKVKVTGTSKGQGFQGVVKRHGFHGSPASHGHKDQLRMPGSIGSKRQGPVQKGKRMAGHMGVDQITVANIEVVQIDEAQNLIYLKGAIPGSRGGLIEVYAPGTMTTSKYGSALEQIEELATPVVEESAPVVATESTTEAASVEAASN